VPVFILVRPAGFEPRQKSGGISLTLNLLLGLRIRIPEILKFKNELITSS
jgi:hypothetical protein